MKRSNKILLGGFLVVLLLIAAFHIALYAKYKKGEFRAYDPEADRIPQAMQTFPNILFVSVKNVQGAAVLFGDVAAVESDEDNDLQFARRGDTLVITGRDSTFRPEWVRPSAMILPRNATLWADHSTLFFASGRPGSAINPVMHLKSSVVQFFDPNTPLRLAAVKIFAADRSRATFNGNTQVETLDVQLSNSGIDFTDGDAGRLTILTDSVSTISLQTRHLLKAKITTNGN